MPTPPEYYVRLQRGITGGFVPPAPTAVFTITQTAQAPSLAITKSERTPGTRVLGDAVPKTLNADTEITVLVDELQSILKSLPLESPPGCEDIYALDTSITWGSDDLEWRNGGPAGCGRSTSAVQPTQEEKDKFKRAVEIVEQLVSRAE
ncbi:hypothetical protein MIND_00433600 [Mycena indigotica]|uniref:Uncharacterized protein n=1 Tax=Mycena indigotica TaxID=2126181 RepID=A0A8H6SW18_9AGAR|nr:uncharacterized protein MIND_00433600 [Mycena indigotica]KAF7306424.1 hypothetical protein MIND_00433600 [Mycena indigotica]